MVPMVKMAVKEIKENLDHKDLQDQEMEVWSLLDGDVPPVLQPMIQNYSTKGKLPGSYYNQYGGGANYICLPDKPEFLSYTPGVYKSQSYIYGAEYETYGGPLAPLDEYNVPCVVCYVSTRVLYLMIPAKITCLETWTTEYQGYLMANLFTHNHNTVYECVDKDAESISGSVANTDGALFNHVQAQCNGLLCPPYNKEKEFACVVCTK